jgi:multidrug resistance protein, MATE family
MMKHKFFTKHFGSEGGISQLLVIAFPMVVSQACDTVMMFTDRLFLSQLSPIHMAASMSGGLTAFMFMTFFMGLTGYATPLVAQYLGSGKEKKCAIVITQALIISVIAYPIILACIPVGHWLFEFVGHNQEQLDLSIIYFDILMYGTLIGLARNSLNGFFCGIGKTRIVMISSIITMVVNVIVNYALILGKFGFPSMGIKGAAIGTIIGGTCGLLFVAMGYLMYHRERKYYDFPNSLRFDANVMKKLFKFGYPGGLEFFLNLMAFDLAVLIFHSYGSDVAAAVTIAFNWDVVAFIPLIGVNIGVTSLVGRFMGGNEPDLAHKTTISGLKLASLYGALMIVLFVFFPGPLVAMFIPDPEENQVLADLSEYMVALVAFYVIADGFSLVYSGALRGAGDTFWTMVISVALHWVFVVEAVVMISIFNLPPKISWAVFVLTVPTIAAAFYLRYRTGKWREIKVVSKSN